MALTSSLARPFIATCRIFVGVAAAALCSCTTDSEAQFSSSQNGTGSAALVENAASAPAQGALMVKSAPDKCLAVADANMTNGAAVIMAPCTGEGSQTWSLVDGALRLGTKCLDITDGVFQNGTKLQLWDCYKTSVNQTWQRRGETFVAGGTWCLDLTDGQSGDGSRAQIWTCAKGNRNQMWVVQPSGTAANANDTADAERTTAAALAAGLDALMPYASRSTASASTSLGTHFEKVTNYLPTGDAAIFLNTPSRVPPVPVTYAEAHWQSFPVTLYPQGTPTPEDVVQGMMDNSGMVAALASLAYVAPSFIQSIIVDNKNGTFTVSMFRPNGAAMKLVVDSQFIAAANNSLGAASGVTGSSRMATWATVLEKAAIKYNAVYKIASTADALGFEDLLPMFTGAGDSFAFAAGALNANQMAQAVQGALSQGMFVALGFDTEMPWGRYTTLADFTFTGMWPGASDAILAARNPWGVNATLEDLPIDAGNTGVLDILAAANIAPHISLRIVRPGAAGSAGTMRPYTPPPRGAAQTVGASNVPYAGRLKMRQARQPAKM